MATCDTNQLTDYDIEELISYIINEDNNPDSDRFAYNHIIYYYEQKCTTNRVRLSFPNRVLWKITGQCNCKCLHCWANLGTAIPREKLLKVAKELSDNHVAMVSLSGGEPLLCKELFEIYRILKNNNAIVEILTNGALINQAWIEEYKKIADLNVDVIQISLDGPCSEIHDKQRNRPIFDKVVENIKLLRSEGIKVRVSITATQTNQNYIYDTYLLAQRLGVNVASISPVFPLRKGKAQENELDDYQYLKQLLLCFRSREQTAIRAQVPFGFQNKAYDYYKRQNHVNNKSSLDCTMFMQETNISMQIDAKGNALPGPEYEECHSAGNVYENTIKNVWSNGNNWQEFREGRDLSNTKCLQCSIYSICGGGNAKMAFDVYKTIKAPDGRCFV